MENFRKVVNPCMCDTGRSRLSRGFAEIKYQDGRLSICGVVGPMSNGNCMGSAGQCVDSFRDALAHGKTCEGWSVGMLVKFCNIWDRWHLNDMRPYCAHMKKLGWDKEASETIEVAGRFSWEKPKMERRGWVRFDKDERGILCKPCPVCGYEYGTKWLFEEVPEEILEWLKNLPDTKVRPAWV